MNTTFVTTVWIQNFEGLQPCFSNTSVAFPLERLIYVDPLHAEHVTLL